MFAIKNRRPVATEREPRSSSVARRAWAITGLLASALVLSGHVGTNDVFYSGNAGPWSVRVSIRQPGVIPGLADISVRVAEAGVDSVLVTARQTRGESIQAPPPDVAARVRGEPNLYAAQLWLMVRGAHEVIVTVAGDAGDGVVRIPVVATASKQLAMSRGLALFVLGGGLFLVIGMLTLVGAASRESVLPAGSQPIGSDRRRALRAIIVAGVALAVVMFTGWRWIDAEATAHRERLDRPWSAQAAIRVEEGARVLDFEITDPLWVNRNDNTWLGNNGRYRRADLVPDHGKLMHMFVVRDENMNAFAHIHPVRASENRFTVAFPPLPAGTYRVYADLTHEDGFAHTLVASVEAPELSATDPIGQVPTSSVPAPDRDDAWWVSGDAASAAAGIGEATTNAAGPAPLDMSETVAVLSDGSIMRWVNAGDTLRAGSDADLVFRVEGEDGVPVSLGAYMGMQGHAMLNRTDGGVFVHLHPTGMLSMAAQATINARAAGSGEAGSSTMQAMTMDGSGSTSVARQADDLRFPLVIPEAGAYRIWVQVRRGEDVLTGSFTATVSAP